MDSQIYIFADSRGKNLKINNVEVKSYPGITLLSLLQIVCKFTEKITSSCIYIYAGINDLTTFERGYRYQELISKSSINIPILFEEIEKMKNNIERNNNKLIFATIPTMNIEKWNKTRLNQGKTSHLKQITNYKEMQNTINNNIQEINRNIIRINTFSNYRTPYLHTTIEVNVPIKRSGTKKRYYYFKLADGIHPTQELNNKIQERFLKAIDENTKGRTDDDTTDESDNEPKRFWKY